MRADFLALSPYLERQLRPTSSFLLLQVKRFPRKLLVTSSFLLLVVWPGAPLVASCSVRCDALVPGGKTANFTDCALDVVLLVL